jgi:t-SNARE complex subunit (syntaxin)
MNDRLGDLGESMPSWAMDEQGQGDVETGFTENIPIAASNNRPSSARSGLTWAAGDDFETAPSSGNETNGNMNVKEEEQKQYMDAFFRDVDSIKADIGHITTVTKRIGDIHDESMLAVSESREKELSQEVRGMIDETNKRAKKTKTLLKVLKDETSKLSKDKSIQSADVRVRENLGNTLTRKFIDEMKLYQNSQQDYKTGIKKKASRQIRTINADATDEEVDQIMKSDGGREEMFQQQILAGGVNDQIKQIYTKVSTKYQDVILLEQSVAELHQMFMDFAILTEEQGELIDQIEHNVKNAKDYVDEANVDIYNAIESSKSIRKKQCCIIILVIIICFVVLFSMKILP